MIVKCAYCNEKFDRNKVEEHHIIPVALFEEKKHTDQYRVLACKGCHEILTKRFLEDGVVVLPSGKKLKVIEDA